MGLLRFLLAVAVVLSHTGPLWGLELVGGAAAVETFFMISGFYMALILNEKYLGAGSLGLFYGNRALRLFPAYWVVLLLTIAASLGAWAFTAKAGRLAPYLAHWSMLDFTTKAYLLLTNLGMVGQDWALFMGLDPTGHLYPTADFSKSDPQVYSFLLVPQAWSLGIELCFYAIAPWLVRRGVAVLALVMIAGICLRAYIYNALQFTDDPWNNRFFPCELSLFLAGALGYKLYARIRHRQLGALPAAATALLIAATLLYQFVPAMGVVYRFEVRGCLYYLLAALAIPLAFIYTRQNRVDRYVGELSYPIYICHVLVVGSALAVGIHHPLFALAATLALSAMLLHFVTEPVERLRQRRSRAAGVRQPG